MSVDEEDDSNSLGRLARDLGSRTSGGDQARWILTQARRVGEAYTDLAFAKWAAHINQRSTSMHSPRITTS